MPNANLSGREKVKRLRPGLALTVLLYVMFATYSVSYVYDLEVATTLNTIKWLLLGSLLALLAWDAVPRPALVPQGWIVASTSALLFVATVAALAGPYVDRAVIALISVSVAITAALLLAKRLQATQTEDRFFGIVAGVGRLIIVVSVATAFLGLNLGRGQRFSGWADNPNSLALLIVPTTVILFARILDRRQKWLWLDLPFLVAGIYILFLTGSRAALGWLAISALAFSIHRANSTLLAFAFFACAGVMLILNLSPAELITVASEQLGRGPTTSFEIAKSGILAGRDEVWAIGLKEAQENPLGFGLGTSGLLLQPESWRFEDHQGLHFHSSYITALVEVGFIGFMLLVCIYVAALVAGYRSKNQQRGHALHRPSAAAVLPWTLLSGAAFHAGFESWLLSAGNANMLLIWTCIGLIVMARDNAHDQSATTRAYR